MNNIETIINGIKINFIKQGQGKNILILPGWGTQIDVYKVLIDNLSKYRTVFCLDMPGCGKSQEPKESWNTNDYVDFINQFIESQNIQELDLIGHSNGGRIIIKFMNQEDLKVKVNKIILIGSAGIVHKKKISKKIKIKIFKLGKKILQFEPIKRAFPNTIENYQNKFGSADYKNATQIMRETLVKLVNEDLSKLLPNIKVPTLLIWGKNDTATPIEDGKLMEQLIPDAGLVGIEECSHYVFLERPEYVNLIINTFLEGEK